MNTRRKLLVVLGAGALAVPIASFAQNQGEVGRIGFLSSSRSDDDLRFGAFKQQLRDLGHVEGKTITIDYLSAEAKNERMPAVSRLAKEGVQALVIFASPMLNNERRCIITLALAHRWPVIRPNKEFAEAGALLSYGADNVANFRRAATFVDKILKGAKPGDIPMEQPTKVDFVVNAITAKALGLTISNEILLRADRVIE